MRATAVVFSMLATMVDAKAGPYRTATGSARLLPDNMCGVTHEAAKHENKSDSFDVECTAMMYSLHAELKDFMDTANKDDVVRAVAAAKSICQCSEYEEGSEYESVLDCVQERVTHLKTELARWGKDSTWSEMLGKVEKAAKSVKQDVNSVCDGGGGGATGVQQPGGENIGAVAHVDTNNVKMSAVSGGVGAVTTAVQDKYGNTLTEFTSKCKELKDQINTVAGHENSLPMIQNQNVWLGAQTTAGAICKCFDRDTPEESSKCVDENKAAFQRYLDEFEDFGVYAKIQELFENVLKAAKQVQQRGEQQPSE